MSDLDLDEAVARAHKCIDPDGIMRLPEAEARTILAALQDYEEELHDAYDQGRFYNSKAERQATRAGRFKEQRDAALTEIERLREALEQRDKDAWKSTVPGSNTG